MAREAPAHQPTLATRLLPERARRWVVVAFFGLLLVAGWRLAPDFGSFTDEATCRESGQISLMYVYECVPLSWLPTRAAARVAALPPYPSYARLATYPDRDYPVAFELPMTLVEKASGYTDMRDVYILRHRCVFVVCWLGCLAMYYLAAGRFGNWRIGLLAVVLLLASPRIFSHFFYNAKDAVFLACFAMATATAVAFVRRPSDRAAAWHALACAVAIDVRIMAILLPAATGGLLAVRALHGDYAGAGRRVARAAALYGVLVVALVIALWPYLWSAPVRHFTEALVNMSRFRWRGTILDQGRELPYDARLPWSYAPVWIGITTPLLYLGGAAISLGLLLRQLWRRGWRLYGPDGEWQDLLFWGLTLVPLVMVAALHSVLYDGWRQLYFVYPSLLLLGLGGLVAAWRWRPRQPMLVSYWRGLVATVVLVSVGSVGATMVQLHPLENLYFNPLAGSHPELRYEYDYWGLSFRQALGWILAHDQRPLIRVQANLRTPCVLNYFMLDPADRQRLHCQLAMEPVDYFITTHRMHRFPYPLAPPVYSFRVGSEGRLVYDIYRFAKPRDIHDLLNR